VKTLLGRLFLAALALVVASFFLAPAVAFFAIRSAAQANDVGGLSRLIEFDAVRTSLRPQLSGRAQALTPPPSFLQDPIGAVRRQFDDAVAAPGPDPDAYLTPDAIDGLLRGEGRAAAVPSGTASDAGSAPWPGPRFWGVNSVRLAVTGEDGSETVFTFARKGLFEWKLVHVGLPDGPTPVPAPVAPPAAK
jgi:hypothetical protein